MEGMEWQLTSSLVGCHLLYQIGPQGVAIFSPSVPYMLFMPLSWGLLRDVCYLHSQMGKLRQREAAFLTEG